MFKSWLPFNYYFPLLVLLTCPAPLLAQGQIPQLPVTNSLSPVQNLSLSEEEPYTLGPGDIIAIEIFNVPEYSRTYQVLIDGTLNLPLINQVSVKGLTLPQVAELITKIYSQKGLLVNPIIAVNLVSPRPINVGIVGEVRNPGSYLVPFRGSSGGGGSQGQGGGSLKFPSVIDALELAKGINASADTRNIQVIRNYKGQEQVLAVNLWEFLQNGDLRQDIILRDGDRIIVPSADAINLREIRQRANADFSADLSIPITITMVGEVNRPGPYTLTGGDLRSSDLNDQLGFETNTTLGERQTLAGLPTATRAIKFAGGLTAKADVRNIEVRRTLPSGQEQFVKVNLWELLQTGDLNQDALLQDGDTIFIPAAQEIAETEARQIAIASFSPNSINVNVVGEVKTPGLKRVQPNTTLQQAVLAAGGFDNRRAKEGNVELIRLNPNGTVSRRKIKVNFGAGLSEENNPPLLNNDVVFVQRSGFAIGSDFVFAFLDPFQQVFSFLNLIKSTFEFTFDNNNGSSSSSSVFINNPNPNP